MNLILISYQQTAGAEVLISYEGLIYKGHFAAPPTNPTIFDMIRKRSNNMSETYIALEIDLDFDLSSALGIDKKDIDITRPKRATIQVEKVGYVPLNIPVYLNTSGTQAITIPSMQPKGPAIRGQCDVPFPENIHTIYGDKYGIP